jgi:leader peptidase (prepilin peptidase)/N-methyltransferase
VNIWHIYSFIFGTMIGSFLNVLIVRLPQELDIIWMRSHCPQCKKMISWFDNIPVISWLVLRGRCRNCNAKISPQYPLIELMTGICFVLLLPSQLNLDSIVIYFIQISIAACFIVHVVIDLRHHLLPNIINLYLAAIFAMSAIIQGRYLDALLGAAIGGLFPLSVTWIFYKIKGVVGLGGGDIKLFAALGLYLGIQGIMTNIFLSCFAGALIGGILLATKKISRETPVPFGPFIILVSTIQIFSPNYFHKFLMIIF